MGCSEAGWPSYLLCGADDGKAKIYDPADDALAGQFVPDGDDDWSGAPTKEMMSMHPHPKR